MKKSLLIFLGIILLLVLWGINIRNTMITKDEAVTANWKQVENVYQRRMDLIPNLVNTVQGYADFEKSTLTEVIEARAQATKVTVDPSKLDAASIQKFEQAQGAISSSLSRLLVVAEQYPDLKANQNFLALQTELEGTENRIANERRKFNETVQDFNTYIRRFPNSLLAEGFEKRGYFEATAGAEKAPEVKFNTK